MLSKNIALLCLLSLTSIWLSAQNQFERVYEATDMNVRSMDMLVNPDGGYYVMYWIDKNENERDTLLGISSLDEKGSENWSRAYTLSDTLKVSALGGELALKENGSLIASLHLDTLGNTLALLELSSTGFIDNSWIHTENSSSDFDSDLLVHGDTVLLSNNVLDPSGNLFHLASRVNETINWAKAFSSPVNTAFVDSEFAREIIQTNDGHYLILGDIHQNALLNGKPTSFLCKLDVDGNILWSRYYTSLIDELVDYQITDIKELPDSSLVLCGYETGGIVALSSGFVCRLDRDGNYMWNSRIVVAGAGITNNFLTNITTNESGSEIVVSGIVQETGPVLLSTPYMFSLTVDGIVNWTSQLKPGLFDHLDKQILHATPEPGYAVLSNYRPDINTENWALYLSSTDTEGVTLCSDQVMMVSTPDTMVVDTFIFEVQDVDFTLDSLDVTMEAFNEFDLVTLSIDNFNFCPDEPIDVTIDATSEGASTYAWSTGESTPSINVTEEGIYMVTVTFDEDICYSLCDSSVVARYNEPSVGIAIDQTNFCVDGTVRLLAQIEAEAGVSSLSWSTGSTEPSIDVSDTETYTVTVIDNCGSVASASINASFPALIDDVQILFDPTNFCESNGLKLTAVAGPGPVSSYIWSDGSMADTTLVVPPGTFSVTVTDICLNEYNTEVNIEKSELPNCNEDCLLFPNIVIPASDEELNRTFKPVDLCNPDPSSFRMTIFNRWGRKLFETTDYDMGWNGLVDEERQPSGVYVYYAIYTVDGIEQEAKGDFTLLR